MPIPKPRLRSHRTTCYQVILAGGALLAAGSIGNAAEPKQSVRMVIDYGDGVQVHFTSLGWNKRLTVLDLIETARKHPHGVSFQMTGAGETAMVSRVGDVANEGAGRNSRNWMFRVNDKLAKVGIGGYLLEPSDAVLWKFSRYQDER